MYTSIDELTISLVHKTKTRWDKENQKHIDLDKTMITKTKVFELTDNMTTDFMSAYGMITEVAKIYDISASADHSLEIVMNFQADNF